MKHFLNRGLQLAAAGAFAVATTLTLQACSDFTDPLLNAPDPDIINPSDVQSSEGALALYNGSFTRLRAATTGTGSGADGDWLWGGLLADEWSTSSTFVQN